MAMGGAGSPVLQGGCWNQIAKEANDYEIFDR
jgi:hypothetical protein